MFSTDFVYSMDIVPRIDLQHIGGITGGTGPRGNALPDGEALEIEVEVIGVSSHINNMAFNLLNGDKVLVASMARGTIPGIGQKMTFLPKAGAVSFGKIRGREPWRLEMFQYCDKETNKIIDKDAPIPLDTLVKFRVTIKVRH